jgi:hypothetical protein
MICRKVPTSYRISATLLLATGLVWSATPSPQRCSLQPEHAAILVMQSPTVAKAKAAGGCPAADYAEKAPGLAGFQVRNLCPKSGNPAIGSYLVDLSSGQVTDSETEQKVDTPTLRTTRSRVCAMSVQGVIPSLLPQGHTSRAGVRRIATGTPRRTASAARKKTTAVR